MSDTLKAVASQNLLDGEVFVNGKVDHIEQYQDRYFFRVMLPAVDEYSQPGVVLVSAKRKIAQLDQPFKAVCRIGGYRNDYDGKSGRVKSARNTLEVAE